MLIRIVFFWMIGKKFSSILFIIYFCKDIMAKYISFLLYEFFFCFFISSPTKKKKSRIKKKDDDKGTCQQQKKIRR